MSEFLLQPGPRERHLVRKTNNPLFSKKFAPDKTELEHARDLDRKELEVLLTEINQAFEQAAALDGRADADDILELKAKMERLYTRANSAAGDLAKIKDAIRKLIGMIETSLRAAAGNDPEALGKINEDIEHTQLHLQISDQTLAADILHEDTVIPEEDLPAVFLTESQEAIETSLLLFSPEQLNNMLNAMETILESESDLIQNHPEYQERATLIRKWCDNIKE
ncbi:MAG: hypothetical protein HUJ29_12865 [Gammaproteobacteria bacterium]|nr:hypothetical protein [Gammaproteobacteria bacterium]